MRISLNTINYPIFNMKDFTNGVRSTMLYVFWSHGIPLCASGLTIIPHQHHILHAPFTRNWTTNQLRQINHSIIDHYSCHLILIYSYYYNRYIHTHALEENKCCVLVKCQLNKQFVAKGQEQCFKVI